MASSVKTNESADASKLSSNHCVQKDENSCAIRLLECTDLSQRQIHGDFRTEAGKVAVGAFVLALVVLSSFSFVEVRFIFSGVHL